MLVSVDTSRSGCCSQSYCGGPNEFGTKAVITTTTHVISMSLTGGGSSSGSGAGGGAIEWFERTTSIAAVEVAATEVVLHLRDGGMRFIPCAHSSGARQELFRVVNRAVAPA